MDYLKWIRHKQPGRHACQLKADKARDKEFLEFKRKENEENHRHEVEIAKIFANAMMQGRSTPAFIPNMNMNPQVVAQWPYV